jgi:GNAT superfamily N-acetyltransferase
MTAYRELFDPNHTLPEVRLDTVFSHDAGFMIRDKLSIVTEEETVGNLDLVSEIHDDERFAHFDGIEIDEDKRGRGIGLATYILAIERSHERGFNFQTQNWELTQYSKKVWEHLAEKAVAQVVEPFTPSPRKEGRFIGKYVVPLQQ